MRIRSRIHTQKGLTIMTVDLKALAQTLTLNQQLRREVAQRINTDEPQRDKFWRTLGKKVRNDVRQTR